MPLIIPSSPTAGSPAAPSTAPSPDAAAYCPVGFAGASPRLRSGARLGEALSSSGAGSLRRPLAG